MLKERLFVAFWTKKSTNDFGSKIQHIFEIKKLLNINVLSY